MFWMTTIAFPNVEFYTEEKKTRRKINTADARRVEQANKVLTGDWTNLPPEMPAGVRIYLCAHDEGKMIFVFHIIQNLTTTNLLNSSFMNYFWLDF